MDPRTRCARCFSGEEKRGTPLAPVIVPAATFGFPSQQAIEEYYETRDGHLYGRYGNPTVDQAARLVAELEGAERAVMFASGMAAISTTVLALTVGSRRRIAAQEGLYGGTAELLLHLLPGMGVEVIWLGVEELRRLDPARLEGCGLLYLETPTNPALRLVDLRAAAAAAREAGVPVVVDSTFATPILQRPVELGCDLVLHSATKYLGGHNDLVGGAVAGSASLLARIDEHRRILGGVLDPFPAFLLMRGMRTLPLRMEAHCRGAMEVAQLLARHANVEQVHYPGLPDHPDHELAAGQMSGFGGMVSFTTRGGGEAAVRVHDRLRLFSRAGSLGGVESLVSIPARMSHRHLDAETRARMGAPDHMIRLSVGLEAPGDLVADLQQALG